MLSASRSTGRFGALLLVTLAVPAVALIGGGLGWAQNPKPPRLSAGQRSSPLIQRALEAAGQAKMDAVKVGVAPLMWNAALSTAPTSSDPQISLGISRITGLVPPVNLAELARRADAEAEAVEHALKKAGPVAFSAAPEHPTLGASVDMSKFGRFSWRIPDFDIVTPSRDQKLTNACWSFATIGAFESAYALKNQLKGSQIVRFSEQAVINCSGAGTAAGGGWWAFAYLRDFGATPFDTVPYTGVDSPGGPPSCGQTTSFRAVNLNYVKPSDAFFPDRSLIKQELVKHGPIACGVLATDQFMSHRDGSVFRERQGYDKSLGANHAVLIVGWNDSKNAWIIKNSYGDNWGVNGFGYVAYETNNIGFGAAWVDAASAQPAVQAVQVGALNAAVPSAEPAEGAENQEKAPGAPDEPGLIEKPQDQPYAGIPSDTPKTKEAPQHKKGETTRAETRGTRVRPGADDPFTPPDQLLTAPPTPATNPAAEPKK